MDNKKKLMISIFLIVGILVIALGVSYAVFTYMDETTNQQLILGDIYMYYNETNTLSIDDGLPGDPYTSYFEFTISGKNESRKDIYYEVILNNGDLPENQTESNRIPGDKLQFKLVEVLNEEEVQIFTDMIYTDLNSQTIHVEKISANTNTEVSKKYRLYARFSEDILIGNVAEADYTSDEWANLFASIKVNVKGDFNKKGIPVNGVDTIKSKYGTDNTLVAVNTGGTLYNGTGEIREYRYSGPTANNYVFFDTNGDGNKTDNEIWRIVGVFKDINGEEKVKLMRNTLLTTDELPTTYTINGKSNTIKSGTTGYSYWNYKKNGTNQNDWTTAGLQYFLNTKQDENGVAGYLSLLSEEARNLVSLTTYHLGNVVNGYGTNTAIIMYTSERGTIKCDSSVTSNTNSNSCDIWYGNQASWDGYIGLLYPSDYGYSASSKYWKTGISSYDDGAQTYSWMQQTANHSSDEWLISPVSSAKDMVMVWGRIGSGPSEITYSTNYVRPVLSLISEAEILDAAGTIDDPYTVVIG